MTNIRYYPDKVCGEIQGWNWIETDTGAWEGPKRDWEQYHFANIRKYCKNFRTVIQAGGNQGMYPRLLSRFFERVYTFEPDPLNFKTLVLNCDSDNIIKFQAALGADKDFCTVNRLSMQNTGMHKIELDLNGNIPTFNGDDVIMRTDVDLIMLDLEGYEYNALLGLARVFQQSNPVIFAENAQLDTISLLREFRYTHVGKSAMDDIFVAS